MGKKEDTSGGMEGGREGGRKGGREGGRERGREGERVECVGDQWKMDGWMDEGTGRGSQCCGVGPYPHPSRGGNSNNFVTYIYARYACLVITL